MMYQVQQLKMLVCFISQKGAHTFTANTWAGQGGTRNAGGRSLRVDSWRASFLPIKILITNPKPKEINP